MDRKRVMERKLLWGNVFDKYQQKETKGFDASSIDLSFIVDCDTEEKTTPFPRESRLEKVQKWVSHSPLGPPGCLNTSADDAAQNVPALDPALLLDIPISALNTDGEDESVTLDSLGDEDESSGRVLIPVYLGVGEDDDDDLPTYDGEQPGLSHMLPSPVGVSDENEVGGSHIPHRHHMVQFPATGMVLSTILEVTEKESDQEYRRSIPLTLDTPEVSDENEDGEARLAPILENSAEDLNQEAMVLDTPAVSGESEAGEACMTPILGNTAKDSNQGACASVAMALDTPQETNEDYDRDVILLIDDILMELDSEGNLESNEVRDAGVTSTPMTVRDSAAPVVETSVHREAELTEHRAAKKAARVALYHEFLEEKFEYFFAMFKLKEEGKDHLDPSEYERYRKLIDEMESKEGKRLRKIKYKKMRPPSPKKLSGILGTPLFVPSEPKLSRKERRERCRQNIRKYKKMIAAYKATGPPSWEDLVNEPTVSTVEEEPVEKVPLDPEIAETIDRFFKKLATIFS